MIRGTRYRSMYPFVLVAIVGAAAILAYYAWSSAVQFARLGDETIAQTTLLLVDEKVDQVEQEIIASDNQVIKFLRRRQGEDIESASGLGKLSATLRAALSVDDSGQVEGCFFRGSSGEKRRFLKLFLEQIIFDMELERQRLGRLRHLHRSYNETSYLLSYKAIQTNGRRRYLVLYRDTNLIVRKQITALFAKEGQKQLVNVVDNAGKRVFGRDLVGAGDYLVGRRFPTTLYEWRLQIAPKQAPRLEAEGRSRRINEVALIIIAFAIVLLGSGFVVYAATAEQRLNNLKAEFIANVSHELKTPLSVVRMFADMLATNRVHGRERQQRYLETICRESERLTTLIDNVLDFSALEGGKPSYAFRVVATSELVTRAVDTLRYRSEDADVEIRCAPEEPPWRLRVDEHAILLAVVNLLDNAVKYGRSPIMISLQEIKGGLEVSVRDHGKGIPQEDLRRVFDRFFRARRDREVRGSGIGLALVKEIAEAHGGRAFARNHPDNGAEVGFILPPSCLVRDEAPKPDPVLDYGTSL